MRRSFGRTRFSVDPLFRVIAMRHVVGIVLLSVFFLTASLFAQQQEYKGWPLTPKTEEEESKKAATVSNALQSGTIDKATFDNYFKKYYFSRWTRQDHISQLNGYVRNDFLKNDLGRATGEARRMLLDITVKAMKAMKSDPAVYPVAQLNAVVVLGNLYEDVDRTIPYGPAIPVLLEELKNEKAPLANQITAIDGLVRYAYLGIADQRLRDKDLPALFISIATAEKVPEGRVPEIHNLFFRAKAVEGLGALCRSAKPAPGESADGLTKIVETLLTILENKSEKIDEVRNNAMNAFAELNLIAASAGGVKLDSARIVAAISSFARATCDRQQQFIEEVRRSEQANTSGGTRGGTSSGEKTTRRIEECIGSSKFAFGTVKNAIQGLSGARNEASIIALLKKENESANAESVKMLVDIQKNIDEYIMFLNKGPQQGTKRGSGGTSGGTTNTAKSGNTPKVTMDDIYNELAVLATKFDELASKKRG